MSPGVTVPSRPSEIRAAGFCCFFLQDQLSQSKWWAGTDFVHVLCFKRSKTTDHVPRSQEEKSWLLSETFGENRNFTATQEAVSYVHFGVKGVKTDLQSNEFSLAEPVCLVPTGSRTCAVTPSDDFSRGLSES